VRALSISEDHALWWSVEPPKPVEIGFAQGRAVLDAASRERLDALVDNAGSWHFEVRGGFSPEGDVDANVDLARSRARAVARYLDERGLGGGRLTTGEAPLSREGVRPEAQRIAVVFPVPPEPP
ncbi:MAG: OmpA family protein, partial [Myxococcota bacterium]